jgi:hypothetical protein
MKEFIKLFKKISIYFTAIYIAIFLFWLAFVIIESKYGFGSLPFGIDKFLGYVLIALFWLIVTPCQLILGSTLFSWFQFSATSNQSSILMYTVSNIINIALIILLSFMLALLKHAENLLIIKKGVKPSIDS